MPASKTGWWASWGRFSANKFFLKRFLRRQKTVVPEALKPPLSVLKAGICLPEFALCCSTNRRKSRTDINIHLGGRGGRVYVTPSLEDRTPSQASTR